MNGKVYALYKNPGEIVNLQQPLATVGSENRFVLEMLVDEVDIVTIIEEQQVLVSLEAYPNEIFKANVSKIYPSKDVRNQTFKVEAIFENPPPTLYPGLSGEANIIVDVKENVLTIPINYLIEGNKVKTEEGILEVTTGLQNEDEVEILSGITVETVLLKPNKS
jgi:multidrug efflux pump subunit AcrA (membrane-fusion protein)